MNKKSIAKVYIHGIEVNTMIKMWWKNSCMAISSKRQEQRNLENLKRKVEWSSKGPISSFARIKLYDAKYLADFKLQNKAAEVYLPSTKVKIKVWKTIASKLQSKWLFEIRHVVCEQSSASFRRFAVLFLFW